MAYNYPVPAKAVTSWDQIPVGSEAYYAYGVGGGFVKGPLTFLTGPITYGETKELTGDVSNVPLDGLWFVVKGPYGPQRMSARDANLQPDGNGSVLPNTYNDNYFFLNREDAEEFKASCDDRTPEPIGVVRSIRFAINNITDA